jgi:hypothetical protein
MLSKYRNFIRGIAVSFVGRLGVALTTSSFLLFLAFELLRMMGLLTNAYIGLITYMLFPALFLVGLGLIPLAWMRYKRSRGLSTSALLNERFPAEDLQARAIGSQLVITVIALTGINLLFMTLASVRTLHFMDQPRFCGTACHQVMGPEWTAYQDSPHAQVACVECHVGEGVEALVDAKLNGLRQLVKASTRTYAIPVPTPVHTLRSASETCQKCHWQEKSYGRRMKIMRVYDRDESSTGRFVTLDLKIDGGVEAPYQGIHWHNDPSHQVRFQSVGDERSTMRWVEVVTQEGETRRYVHDGLLPEPSEEHPEGVRVMDCTDCHNRVAHQFHDPEEALDGLLASGRLDRRLPYLKREGLNTLKQKHLDKEQAKEAIRQQFTAFYRAAYPNQMGQWLEAIDEAVAGLQGIYERNVFPKMGLFWSTHPDHRGHRKGGGCFRCHNEHLKDEAGQSIPFDCTLCHSMLSDEGAQPFEALKMSDPADPLFQKNHYLREEYLQSIGLTP